MASNQPPERHLEAAAAFVKQLMAAEQQGQPPAAAQNQFLNQYLGGGGGGSNAVLSHAAGGPGPLPLAQVGAASVAGLPPQQASLGSLVADYLKAQGTLPGVGATTAVAPALPPNLLANLQAAAKAAAPTTLQHAPHPPPPMPSLAPLPAPLSQAPLGITPNAAQQQLLASAQLLSTINPGLAAAAMAQALAMSSTTNQPGNNGSVLNGGVQQQQHHHPAPAGAQQQQQQPPHHGAATGSLLLSGQQQSAFSHQAGVAPQPQHKQLAQPALQQFGHNIRVNQHTVGRSASVGSVGPSARPPSSHSNRSSPHMAAATLSQQPRPLSAMAALTKPGAIVASTVHPVSSGSSISTGNNEATKPVQAMSTTAGASSSSPSNKKKLSPKNMGDHHPAQSSITSASLPSFPNKLSPGSSGLLSNGGSLPGGSLPKMNVASAAAIHHHRGHHNSAAVAASAVPSKSAMSVPSSAVRHVPISTMQRWNLEQLEAHVKQLREANQTVPQAVALLVADTRRKEEKRQAKRLANRKSACTSRARKKALIEEMTKDNARLRRQALILSYLPDPVVAISTEGVIMFCSMQVERVLKHKVSGLIGANIEEIIVPSSRESIRRLIRDLVIAEQRALSSSVEDAESGENRSHQNGGGSESSVRENNSVPHEVSEPSSEQSFPPLLEVKVKAKASVGVGEDVSDSSGDPPSKNGQAKSPSDGPTDMSSLTHKNSSFGPESSEDQAQPPPANKKAKTCANNNSAEKKQTSTTTPTTESDESTSSENNASANLTKNVEMCKLNIDKMEGAEQVRFSHKDDVMGASVTANNADAKLSSLMHHPSKKEGEGDSSSSDKPQPEEKVASIRRKHALGPKIGQGKPEEQSSSSANSSLSKTKKRSGNSSEDSGYRESGESPEENEYAEDSSSSSAASSERSSSKKKRRRTRPLAPACNVRLIRNDLSTIWCELTSSIRTRPLNDGHKDPSVVPPSQLKQGGNQKMDSSESAVSSDSGQEEKELLLCFRPIREGEEVGEELRFCPKVSVSENADGSEGSPASSDEPKVSSSANSTSRKAGAVKKEAKKSASSTTSTPSSAETQAATAPTAPAKKNRPPKKRRFESEEVNQPCKKKSHDDHSQVAEKSAVESMMELAKTSL
ncbi:hypothetical protein ACHAXR_008318 [Thalassiosira sp. AJA248-18]